MVFHHLNEISNDLNNLNISDARELRVHLAVLLARVTAGIETAKLESISFASALESQEEEHVLTEIVG